MLIPCLLCKFLLLVVMIENGWHVLCFVQCCRIMVFPKRVQQISVSCTVWIIFQLHSFCMVPAEKKKTKIKNTFQGQDSSQGWKQLVFVYTTQVCCDCILKGEQFYQLKKQLSPADLLTKQTIKPSVQRKSCPVAWGWIGLFWILSFRVYCLQMAYTTIINNLKCLWNENFFHII